MYLLRVSFVDVWANYIDYTVTVAITVSQLSQSGPKQGQKPKITEITPYLGPNYMYMNVYI